MERACGNCMFAFFVDYGYSSYTVEGTDFYCGVNKHPLAPFDRWYGDDKRLLYAQQCDSYAEGKAVSMDVDREDLSKPMTVAQRIMWRQIENAERPPERKKGEGV